MQRTGPGWGLGHKTATVQLHGWVVESNAAGEAPSAGVTATDPATWGDEFHEEDHLLSALQGRHGQRVQVTLVFEGA